MGRSSFYTIGACAAMSIMITQAILNVFGTVQNIATITGYSGIDPEVFGGIDGTVYPRPRTFVLGAKLNF